MRDDAGRPGDVVSGIALACANCGCRFRVSEQTYRSCSGAVECPACGCLDLVLLEDERTPSGKCAT